ncbi:MAG: enoyl-CoA hydratase/isomerase family protein [Proteobacteria bacterium]|nr:enoyl-CoA hydratase/isomerase family protein [Pseudomonadota bacterium]
MAGEVNKVCVIGAGVMGAGIAAQVANAGVPVLLLDILPKEGSDRSAVAKGAVAKMLKTDPAPFMSAKAAKLVECGNIEDDLHRVAECDWVVEAIVEKLEIKQSLYARLEELRAPHAAISSNTSTIPLHKLVEGRSEAFRQHFLITHFFNPPRYMRLLELALGADTDPALAARIGDFADRKLGKSVVHTRDTPGFIANRIGTYWLTVATNAAADLGLTVEEADQVGGRPMGVPKTGIFGLIDLVGLDLMPLLSASLSATLPAGDAYFAAVRPNPLADKMIAEGFTGRKGKGGFYRLEKQPDGRRAKLAIDLATGLYRPQMKPAPLPDAAAKDLAALVALDGKEGAFARAVLYPVLAYAADLAGVIADDVVAIDAAMKLGYNWKWGPFELIDRLGPGKLAAALAADGQPVPAVLTMAGERPFYRLEGGRREFLGLDGAYHPVQRPEGVLLLEDLKRTASPLLKNDSAALWDVGDGVAAFEFTTKMNALDEGVITLLLEAIELVKAKMKALVIYNEADNFSAGANLGFVMFGIGMGAWDKIEASIAGGQNAYKALKYAPFPVVSAPAGLALGGGCEICLHSSAVQAHAETYIGLVETGVGVIPGWGGCGEMLDRFQKSPLMPRGPMPALMKAFELISTAQVAKSAANAKELGFLKPTDGVTMNRDRLLADAKARALAMVPGYVAPEPPTFRLPGEVARVGVADALEAFHARGMATDYDMVVGGRLANVLSGGDTDVVDIVSEQDLLDLERAAFMECLRDERTQARIRHMLETGKPLRN